MKRKYKLYIGFFILYLKADLSTRNNFVHWPCSADRASIKKVSYKDEM